MIALPIEILSIFYKSMKNLKEIIMALLHKLSAIFGAKEFLIAAATLSTTACASLGSESSNLLADGDFYTQDFPEISENTLAISATQGQFRVGDVADINFYNIDSLSNSYTVNYEGNVNFPIIGNQKVAGLTPLGLQQQLTTIYGESYLQNPNITVKRQANVLGNIVVDGSVSKPGVFELYKPVRLSEAVALAGGLTENANSKEVYVVREIEGKKKVKIVNLKEIRRAGGSDPDIYPQDIVYVQDSSGKVAFNEFLKTVPLLSTLVILGTR